MPTSVPMESEKDVRKFCFGVCDTCKYTRDDKKCLENREISSHQNVRDYCRGNCITCPQHKTLVRCDELTTREDKEREKEKKSRKPPTYVDTFNFKWFPKYQYTKFQQRRFRFFLGRIKSFKKDINYADRFNDPNVINLVYMMGYNDKVKPYVMEHTVNNTVVLCADIPKEHLDYYDEYIESAKQASSWGPIHKETLEPNDKLWEYMEDQAKLRVVFEEHGETLAEDPWEIFGKKAIRFYELKEEVQKYFKRYIICDKLHPEKTIDHKDLDKIIKRYFPRGREEQGCNVNCLRPTQVKKAILAGLHREPASKLVGLPDGVIPFDKFKTSIKRLEMDVNTEIRENGYADLVALVEAMKAPPYGFAEDTHAAYCVGYALSSYLDKAFICDGCIDETFDERWASALGDLLQTPYNGRRQPILYTETGWRLANRLEYIFGIPAQQPVASMLRQVWDCIPKKTRIPISVVDERLYDILNEREGSDVKNVDDMKSILKYLSWDKCKELKEAWEDYDAYAEKVLKEQFPDIHMDELNKFKSAEAAGPCWAKQTYVDLCVDLTTPDRIEDNEVYFWPRLRLYRINRGRIKEANAMTDNRRWRDAGMNHVML